MTLSMATIHLLMIEDNIADTVLLRAACEAAGLPCVIDAYASLEESLDHVRSCVGTSRMPDAVLLDFHLKGSTAIDALRGLRALPGGADLLVVVLSGTRTPDRWAACEAEGAETYFLKGATFSDWIDLAYRLGELLGVTLRRTRTAQPEADGRTR
jgi:CheY-like chemotaxis protein